MTDGGIPESLDRGRAAFARRAWREAYESFVAARGVRPLPLEDLERLALTAHLIGHDDESVEVRSQAHQEALGSGDVARAAHHAFWAGFVLLNKGQVARGGGWLARAARLLEESGVDVVESGYLRLPVGLRALGEGDLEAAFAAFTEASEVAARFRDPDLGTLSRLGRGVSLVQLGDRSRGLALLDEAMVAVTSSEVSPIVVGVVYCAVIEACRAIFDLERAQEWTAELTRWCETQPDLVPFRGQCQLYRAELLELHGLWGAADAEVREAHDRLARPPPEPAVSEAIYRRAELDRLRGSLGAAEEGYRDSAARGGHPDPGLALLRLAQNRPDAAAATIRRALDETPAGPARPMLLAAAVEIFLAVGGNPAARAAAHELGEIAARYGASRLLAMAAAADGAVLLADGRPREALVTLSRARDAWLAIDAPYEVARVRVLIGLACHAIGDLETAALERDVARETFRRLGAGPDLDRLNRLTPPGSGSAPPGGLSAREVEVLRLVAEGLTNRAVAAALGLSERTIDRHLSNIFDKLAVPTRAAATAWAYQQGIAGAAMGGTTHADGDHGLGGSGDAAGGSRT